MYLRYSQAFTGDSETYEQRTDDESCNEGNRLTESDPKSLCYLDTCRMPDMTENQITGLRHCELKKNQKADQTRSG